MVQALQTEVAKVLGLSNGGKVDPTANFFDLGMDSLMAVELKNRLDSHLEQPIASTVIFEHSTLQALAAHLVERASPTAAQQDSNQASEEPSSPLEPEKTEPITANSDPPALDNSKEHEEDNEEISPDIQQELTALESLLNRS